MNSLKYPLLILLVTVFSFAVNAQEFLYDAPVPKQNSNHFNKTQYQQKSSVTLPFFDDFSAEGTKPNTSLWQDDDVFINNNYAKGLPSIGVATFDAVDGKGEHYKNSYKVFRADKLTSQPINLQGADFDSLWLSFYYQPQGFGNAPEPKDSLIVEFTVDGKTWKKIWGVAGADFQTFCEKDLKLEISKVSDTNAFKLAMVKLDTTCKSDKFQFRFVNYASLSGDYNPSAAVNCDNWNVDYVYLNDKRSANDTIFKDVAFVAPPNSFLRSLQSVPWSHYNAVQKKELSKVTLKIRNNYNNPFNVSQTEFIFTDLKTNKIIDSINITQLSAMPLINNDIDWKFSSNPFFDLKDEKELDVQFMSRLKTDDDYKQNNKTSKNYYFRNYYAYDDGTAENAYGIESMQCMVAYKFRSYVPDSLKAIRIYFLQTYPENEGLLAFSLCVWESDNGKPGKLIFEDKGVEPIFTDELNKFAEFELSKSVSVDGDFFIGWKQYDNKRINIGFDRNNNNRNKIFFNIDGSWKNTKFAGSLMMRPVLGYLTTSIDESSDELSVKQKISIYPNPVVDEIHFKGINYTKTTFVEVFTLQGQKILTKQLTDDVLNVSALQSGVYVLFVKQEGLRAQVIKFVK